MNDLKRAENGNTIGMPLFPCIEVQAPVLETETLFHRVAGDFDLLREIIDLFLDEAPKLAGEIRTAVARNDAAALTRSAHRLKGSAANLSAQRVVHLALRLEAMGRQEQVEDAEPLCEDLHQAIAEVGPELEALVNQEAA